MLRSLARPLVSNTVRSSLDVAHHVLLSRSSGAAARSIARPRFAAMAAFSTAKDAAKAAEKDASTVAAAAAAGADGAAATGAGESKTDGEAKAAETSTDKPEKVDPIMASMSSTGGLEGADGIEYKKGWGWLSYVKDWSPSAKPYADWIGDRYIYIVGVTVVAFDIYTYTVDIGRIADPVIQ